MASANVTLPNGTHVEISGTPEEVHKLLALYSGGTSKKPAARSVKTQKKSQTSSETEDAVDITAIVNMIKTCSEAELIEERVLDSTRQLDRVIVPLFVVARYFDNQFGLTTGEISKITTELGVRISTPNVSKTVRRASRFVLGDQARKKGTPVRYKLNRRGVQYMESVLGDPDRV